MGNATHRLVLQDDAILCPDFLEGITEACQRAPQDVAISPFACGYGLKTAMRQGKQWATVTQMAWGTAHILPAAQVDGFLRATLDHHFWPPEVMPEQDDGRLRKWHMTRREAVWCPLPSLVDHDVAQGTQQSSGAGGQQKAAALATGAPFDYSDTSDPWKLTETEARMWWSEE